LYNHAAIWSDPSFWPRSFACNGHLMIISQKMSKSTGNFLTLEQAISQYGCDCTRLTLAMAGDSLEDANFDPAVSNASILRLSKEEIWFKDVIEALKQGHLRDGTKYTFMDVVFLNRMNDIVELARVAYDKLKYQQVVVQFYQLCLARDQYRINETQMHKTAIKKFIELFSIILHPICPHFTQHIWIISGHEGEVGMWPETEPIDRLILKQMDYLQRIVTNFRQAHGKFMEKKKKGLKTKTPKSGDQKSEQEEKEAKQIQTYTGSSSSSSSSSGLGDNMVIQVTVNYKDWQKEITELIKKQLKEDKSVLCDRSWISSQVRSLPSIQKQPKLVPQALSFASLLQEECQTDPTVLDHGLGFDEANFLEEQTKFLTNNLNFKISSIQIQLTVDDEKTLPGRPSVLFS